MNFAIITPGTKTDECNIKGISKNAKLIRDSSN